MTREDLDELQEQIMETVVTRRKLGGYNADAATILELVEWMLKIVHHMHEKAPRASK